MSEQQRSINGTLTASSPVVGSLNYGGTVNGWVGMPPKYATVRTFDTVADMAAARDITVGAVCHTLGFHAVGDGGASFYQMTATGTANGMDIIECASSIAHIVVEDCVIPEQLGAYGDGTHDDTDALQYAFDFAKANGVPFKADKMYRTSDTISFSGYNVSMGDSIVRYAGERDRAAFDITGIKCRFEFGIVVDDSIYDSDHNFNSQGGWHGWSDDSYVGILVHNTNWCVVSALNIVDFTVGLKLSDQNGWGCFDIQTIRNCKIGIEIVNTTDSSWNNANRFSNTEINYAHSGTSFISADADRICVLQHCESGAQTSCNSNIFENFKFEWHHDASSYTCAKFDSLMRSVFDNCRFELPGTGSKGFIADLTSYDRNVYTMGNACSFLNDKPSLSVLRNLDYIMPADYSVMKIYNPAIEYWSTVFYDAIEPELCIKVQTNRNIMRGRVYATGSASSDYASKSYSIYTSDKPFANNALTGSISGGAITYFVDMPTKCNIMVKTTNRLPTVQCFDSNGAILTGRVAFSTSYGNPVNNATYNYVNPSVTTEHICVISFADIVRYAKLMLVDLVDIEVSSDRNDTVISAFPTTEANPMLNRPGYSSNVIPQLFDAIPLYTVVWDMRSGHDGEYWQYEIVSNVKTWVNYS